MKIGKAHALGGKRINVRCSYFASKRPDIGKTPVIGKENDDIGTPGF